MHSKCYAIKPFKEGRDEIQGDETNTPLLTGSQKPLPSWVITGENMSGFIRGLIGTSEEAWGQSYHTGLLKHAAYPGEEIGFLTAGSRQQHRGHLTICTGHCRGSATSCFKALSINSILFHPQTQTFAAKENLTAWGNRRWATNQKRLIDICKPRLVISLLEKRFYFLFFVFFSQELFTPHIFRSDLKSWTRRNGLRVRRTWQLLKCYWVGGEPQQPRMQVRRLNHYTIWEHCRRASLELQNHMILLKWYNYERKKKHFIATIRPHRGGKKKKYSIVSLLGFLSAKNISAGGCRALPKTTTNLASVIMHVPF